MTLFLFPTEQNADIIPIYPAAWRSSLFGSWNQLYQKRLLQFCILAKISSPFNFAWKKKTYPLFQKYSSCHLSVLQRYVLAVFNFYQKRFFPAWLNPGQASFPNLTVPNLSQNGMQGTQKNRKRWENLTYLVYAAQPCRRCSHIRFSFVHFLPFPIFLIIFTWSYCP